MKNIGKKIINAKDKKSCGLIERILYRYIIRIIQRSAIIRKRGNGSSLYKTIPPKNESNNHIKGLFKFRPHPP